MKIIGYLKRFINWLIIGKFHLLTFVFVIITLFYLIGFITYQPVYVSSIFSILGLSIILTQQLVDAKQFSDYKPNTIHNWFKSFPKIKPTIINIKSSGVATISTKVYSSISISKDASLESKIEFLINQVSALDRTIVTLDKNLDKVSNDIKNKSEEFNRTIEKVNKTFKSTIAGHIVGSYDINLFGIIITLCGTLIQIFSVAKTP